MDAAAFEHDRLELFRKNGFEGESRTLRDAAGRTTYAILRGRSTCPTVLVHGGLADASVWSLMAGQLGGAVVIPDRPGHGLSSGIDYSGVDFKQSAVDWLLHVLDDLGAEQADLVGNSMGGFFSMAFAIAHPRRVRRLVLAGAPAGLDRQLPLFLRLWGRPVIGHLISSMKISDPEVMRQRVMTGLCARPEAIPLDALQIAATASSKPGWGRMAQSLLHAATDIGGWRRELAMREPMLKLAVPTLFAWGDADSFAPPSSGEELAQRMPDARVEVIPGGGHLVQLDEPRALAESIQRFFGAVDAKRVVSGAAQAH